MECSLSPHREDARLGGRCVRLFAHSLTSVLSTWMHGHLSCRRGRSYTSGCPASLSGALRVTRSHLPARSERPAAGLGDAAAQVARAERSRAGGVQPARSARDPARVLRRRRHRKGVDVMPIYKNPSAAAVRHSALLSRHKYLWLLAVRPSLQNRQRLSACGPPDAKPKPFVAI